MRKAGSPWRPGTPRSLQVYGGGIAQESYFGNNLGLYAALLRRGQPFDARLVETTSPAQLRRYRVAVLADARSLTPEQTSQVREWVRAGGTLIAAGGTTVCDAWGRLQQDFGLSDAFGLHLAGLAQGASSFRATTGSGAPRVVAYPKEYPYVKVTPDGATVAATWDNGDPALLRHSFGQGRVIFLTACRPGLYSSGAAAGTGLPAESRPGFPGLVRALVDEALVGTTEAVSVAGALEGLEVQLRQAAGAMVVHLLDWHDDRDVRGLRLRVNQPGSFEVLYPGDEQPAGQRVLGPGTVTLRPFRGYDLVAIRRAR
jgi:hypothetical protein